MYLSKFGWIRRRHQIIKSTHLFSSKPWAGGVILLVSVAFAMIFANMEWSKHFYHELLTTDLSILIHTADNEINLFFPKNMNLEKLINDGLMVIFFFVVGLEIKREVLHGELSTFKQAILPVMAAIGGMVVPAIIYFIINQGTSVEIGWGIPMATDIAFVIGILTLLGRRVPLSLKIFLMALAIADDLGAIIIIALFYGGAINLTCLTIALVIVLGVFLINRLGEREMIFYIIPGIVVWTLFYYSGIHATLSGVIMAMLVPSKPRYSKAYFLRKISILSSKINNDSDKSDELSHHHLHHIHRIALGSISMSDKLEEALTPFVAFVIMPIFALANAGVEIDINHLNIFKYSPIEGAMGLGIFLGLVLGKPIGITLMSWIAVKLKFADMPSGANWKMLFAVAALAGIGFTMSIFIDTLAFFNVNISYVDQGKIAILISSLAASLLGIALIFLFSRGKVTD
ncbi:MAG: Na+/H+ antiporter NhaA [Rikenellaceae bacterium]